MRYHQIDPTVASGSDLSEAFSITDLGAKVVDKVKQVKGNIERRKLDAETQANINAHTKLLMRVTQRYLDGNNKPINNQTMDQLPADAIYSFLKGTMKLSDAAIDRILADKNIPGSGSMTAHSINTDKTLGEIIPGLDSATALQLLKRIAALATVWWQRKARIGADHDAPPPPPPSSTSTVWSPGDPIEVAGQTYQPGDPQYNKILAIVGTPQPRP